MPSFSRSVIGCVFFGLLLVGCRSAGVLEARPDFDVEVPPELRDRSQKGLAVEVLTSPEVSRSGWSIVAIRDESIRVRRSTESQAITVDIFFDGERLVPVLIPGHAGAEAMSEVSRSERTRLADLAREMSRVMSRLSALAVPVQVQTVEQRSWPHRPWNRSGQRIVR